MKKYIYILTVAGLVTTAVIFNACKDEEKTAAVQSVSLNKTEMSLLEGYSETLSAVIIPENATNTKVKWESDDETVATVDKEGKVTGQKAGVAKITVITIDGGKMATCNVTVTTTPIEVESISIRSSLTLVIDSEETLALTFTPENATNKNVTWDSSDKTVASVDAAGKVTALKLGTTDITVTTEDGGKTATCNVTVVAEAIVVESVSLIESLTLSLGEVATLVPTFTPENATNQNVTWSSSDEKVASVDATGKVTGLKAGTADITVTTVDGEKTAKCAVTVTGDQNLGPNLLQNSDFEAGGVGNGWTQVPIEWFEEYYVCSREQFTTGTVAITPESWINNSANAGYPIRDIITGGSCARSGQTTSGLYQLVNVVEGKNYFVSVDFAYRCMTAAQKFANQTLKIFAEDGKTLYDEIPLVTSGTFISETGAAFECGRPTTVSKIVKIPNGVTQVRFQISQFSLKDADGQATEPVFIFDELKFQEVMEE